MSLTQLLTLPVTAQLEPTNAVFQTLPSVGNNYSICVSRQWRQKGEKTYTRIHTKNNKHEIMPE
jgi:hypothetical protein